MARGWGFRLSCGESGCRSSGPAAKFRGGGTCLAEGVAGCRGIRSSRGQVAGRRAVTARDVGLPGHGAASDHRSSRRRPPGSGTPAEAPGRYRFTGLPRRQDAVCREGGVPGRCVLTLPAPRRSSAGVRVAGTSHRNDMRHGDAGHGVSRQGIGAPGRLIAGHRPGSPTGRRGTGPPAGSSSTRQPLGTPARCDAASAGGRVGSPARRVARPPRRAVAEQRDGRAPERPGTRAPGRLVARPPRRQAASSPGRREPRGRPADPPGRSVCVAESEQLGGVAVGLWKGRTARMAGAVELVPVEGELVASGR